MWLRHQAASTLSQIMAKLRAARGYLYSWLLLVAALVVLVVAPLLRWSWIM